MAARDTVLLTESLTAAKEVCLPDLEEAQALHAELAEVVQVIDSARGIEQLRQAIRHGQDYMLRMIGNLNIRLCLCIYTDI